MILILLLGISSTAHGFSTFTPNCTAPTEQVNFVTDSDTRSTLGILWSCLFTIFTCTWTVLHLPVPEQREGRDPGTWGDLKWNLKSLLRTLKWTVMMILMPELLMGIAIEALLINIRIQKLMKEQACEDGVEWTTLHTVFTNIGGFAISTDRSSTIHQYPQESKALKENPTPLLGTDRTQGMVTEDDEKNTGHLIFLNASALMDFRRQGLLSTLPKITKDEINDRSKSDIFVKSLAIIQVCSAIIEIISRHVRGLAISQLEVAVTAFAFCAFIIFGAHFYTPKDVKTPIIIRDLQRPLSFDQAVSLVGPHRTSDSLQQVARRKRFDPGFTTLGNNTPESTIGQEVISPYYVMGFAGAIFGGIHCLAWSFAFPTSYEVTLWKVASITTAALPIVFVPMTIYISSDKHVNRVNWYQIFCLIVYSAIILFYTLARLVILVEVFRTLCFLPPSAYISTWASNIPQFA